MYDAKNSWAHIHITEAQSKTVSIDELETARILAIYFNTEVTFIDARNAYLTKTPDVEMNGRLWEFKHPRGSSKKHTIKDQLKRGKRQSRNIVINTQSTPLGDDFIIKESTRRLLNKDARIQKLIIIDKNMQVHILK